MSLHRISIVVLTAGFCALVFTGNAEELPALSFAAPEQLTCSGALSNAQLSRSATSNLTFDRNGALHLVWWTGTEYATPSEQSAVYHARWTAGDGWSEGDKIAGAPETFGARHPSMALLSDDSLCIVWHDHRHCTEQANYIDNIEIYRSLIIADGVKLINQERLTQTTAEHKGDNGYCPKLVLGTDGKLWCQWYDFNGNYNISDEYLAEIKTGNIPFDMSAARLTNVINHPSVAFTLNDAAALPDGVIGIVYVAGLSWNCNLVYMTVGSDLTVKSNVTIAVGDVAYYDPALICVSPVTSEPAILWPSQDLEPSQIKMAQPTSENSFSVSYIESLTGATQQYVDAKFDQHGYLHIVWNDDRDGNARIRYICLDPTTGKKTESVCLTPDGAWGRPTLALNSEGYPYVITESDAGSLWLITPMKSSVKDWTLF